MAMGGNAGIQTSTMTVRGLATGQLQAGEIGWAMVAAVVLSAGLGAIIPLLFRSMGVDPAVASGPLITTLNDALSLVLYFSIAVAMLQRWG